jgi:hypothetical protein
LFSVGMMCFRSTTGQNSRRRYKVSVDAMANNAHSREQGQ